MSEPENFLARWSRLKRESVLEAGAARQPAAAEALPRSDEPPAPAFDPTRLPAVELIDAATDIRPFLETSVPEELTRAALRSAWSADPAIRDFVGIAEAQWDFNDPDSIPGFGGHTATDYLGRLAAAGVGSVEIASGRPAEHSPVVGPAMPEGHETLNAAVGAPAEDSRGAEPFAECSAAEGDLGPRTLRTHGGALPE